MGIIPAEVECSTRSNLSHKENGHDCSVGKKHCSVFIASSTAGKERHCDQHHPHDDEYDRPVQVGALYEVKVVVHVQLHVNSNSKYCSSGKKQEEVEQEDDVLQHVVA